MLGDAGIPSMLASIPSFTYIGAASIPCASPNHPPRVILATPLPRGGLKLIIAPATIQGNTVIVVSDEQLCIIVESDEQLCIIVVSDGQLCIIVVSDEQLCIIVVLDEQLCIIVVSDEQLCIIVVLDEQLCIIVDFANLF